MKSIFRVQAMDKALSVNRLAWKLAEALLDNQDFYGVNVAKTSSGARVVDAGLKARGGFQAGRIITEICMGGCGKAEIDFKRYDDLELPSITVSTDHPAIAALGSQFAGWRIKNGDSVAIGSGPARALALKPKEIYQELAYKDESDRAVLVLETDKPPSDTLIERVVNACQMSPENLIVIFAPTASIAGSTQVTGRIVETGVHKLRTLGLNPHAVRHAVGYAPIPPLCRESEVAMARTNDAILYGGTVHYTVEYDDEEALRKILEQAPSKAAKNYGKPFLQIFKEADRDFYKIDPNLFAPAVLVINNVKSGKTFKAGEINVRVLKEALGF
jgi:methenyltetrahydromethanopterin cyclohydrolase